MSLTAVAIDALVAVCLVLSLLKDQEKTPRFLSPGTR